MQWLLSLIYGAGPLRFHGCRSQLQVTIHATLKTERAGAHIRPLIGRVVSVLSPRLACVNQKFICL